MKQTDLQRVNALVREYWSRGGPGIGSAWYFGKLEQLRHEIGEERVFIALEEYENNRMTLCESEESRRHEELYQ